VISIRTGLPIPALVNFSDVTVRSPPVSPAYALPAAAPRSPRGVGVGHQPAQSRSSPRSPRGNGAHPGFRHRCAGLPSLFDGTTNEEVAVATGDLNGDGRYDIAAAIMEGGRDAVIVWLSSGSGFQPRVQYAVASYVREVAIADLNRDGKPDILTANDAASVSVLLNTGNGSMAAATDYSIPGELTPSSIAVASLVGPDNYPDVALAIPDDNELFVFQGDGQGALTPSPEMTSRPVRQRTGLVFVSDSAKTHFAPRIVQLGQDTLGFGPLTGGRRELRRLPGAQGDRARQFHSPCGWQPGRGRDRESDHPLVRGGDGWSAPRTRGVHHRDGSVLHGLRAPRDRFGPRDFGAGIHRVLGGAESFARRDEPGVRDAASGARHGGRGSISGRAASGASPTARSQPVCTACGGKGRTTTEGERQWACIWRGSRRRRGPPRSEWCG
jgi:hypothetical protein